jgi:hypothetical protein
MILCSHPRFNGGINHVAEMPTFYKSAYEVKSQDYNI